MMLFDTALMCLALNLYHEARSEPIVGQMAVASVVLNRVKDPRFPNDICSVVHEGPIGANGHPIRHKCQFSWYCDGKDDKPMDPIGWQHSFNVASYMLNGKPIDVTEGALFYHADYVSPNWENYQRVVKIESHIFYTIKADKKKGDKEK